MFRASGLALFVRLILVLSPLSFGATGPPSDFVVTNGVRLHYLDWGGNGPALLLLSGIRDTAHVFDSLALAFTDRFHVYALTRRGFGESGRPKSGYDTSTRVEDIHGFLDALKIAKADLIGHSLAGEELTLFAGRYPERVEKLVYFDTLFDHSPEVWKEMQSDPVPRSSLIQKASMEALGLPGAARIRVSQMPSPDEWAILVATPSRHDQFSAGLPKSARACPRLLCGDR